MLGTLTTATGVTCALPNWQTSADTWSMPTSASPDKTYTFILSSCPALTDAGQLAGATLALAPTVVRSDGTRPTSLSIDLAWLEVTSGNDSPPSAFATMVDPDHQRAMWMFGPVQLPSGGVDVNWQGSTSPLPPFSGGLLAQGLASYQLNDFVRVGTLAAPSVQQASRRVLLRAVIDGRLVGSAIVTLDDASDDGTLASPGNHLSVDDWRLCNQPVADDGAERPCPPP
jgi:hypothetical protein